MKLNLEDKLDIIIATPFGLYESDVKSSDEELELGLDKRLAITRSYRDWYHNIRYIEQTRNAARDAGLDQEFGNVVKSVIEPERMAEIAAGDPFTYQEAAGIVVKLATTRFGNKLNEREASTNQLISIITDPDAAKAADILINQRLKPIASSKKPTLMQFLNPHDLKPGSIDLRYLDESGKIIQYKLGMGHKVLNQWAMVQQALEDSIKFNANAPTWRTKYEEIYRNMLLTYKARLILLRYTWPDIDDSQRKHTAAYYTIRTTANSINTTAIDQQNAATAAKAETK